MIDISASILAGIVGQAGVRHSARFFDISWLELAGIHCDERWNARSSQTQHGWQLAQFVITFGVDVESARFTVDALELVIDGRLAYSDTKRSLLDAGIAVLLDLDPANPHWEHATSALLEADNAIGLAAPLVIPGGTRDTVVVAIARKYWEAVNTEGFVEQVYRSPKNGEPGKLLAGPMNSQT